MKVKKFQGKRNGEEDMFVVLMNRSEVEDIIVALALLDSWQAVYGKAAEPGESVDKIQEPVQRLKTVPEDPGQYELFKREDVKN